ncbi:aromatase [Streptacidiphilus sp. MAP12-33]|uniref:aromatase/cyclase n=1 Tax=Streptacidiphilus sp. MAP12-33 TaxID=3156266 RepID=UPI003513CC19
MAPNAAPHAAPHAATTAGTTRMTHRIDVAAQPEAVYRIVADVARWPLYFPPTVRAAQTSVTESADGGATEETIRLWALANGRLRTWESRRSLRPQSLQVEFEQVTPASPVALMGGAWRLEPTPEGGTSVRLEHWFRAAGDDPAALEQITRAVDTNSRSELEHLRRAAERGDTEAELYLDFSDSETVAGSLSDVYDFVYEAAKWPVRLPHVARLELQEDEPGLQFMEMDTRSPDGSVHTTASGRVCETDRRITYKQTTLPPAFLAHNGEWTFEAHPEDDTVTVTSRHFVLLDPEGLAKLPQPPASLDAAKQAVRHALGSNSRATMAKAREFAEARRLAPAK